MNAHIRQLESEAEAARAKLAADLAVLRAPSTYSEFKDGLKQEAIDAKDAVVESVRSNVKSTAEGWIDEIKAKAAANPGAALLIGAGVAWRLMKDPPIATALVGAGLFSLLRTSPEPGDRHMSDEAYLEQAKYRLKEQANDLASGTKDLAADLAGKAKTGVAGLTDSAKERVGELADSARAQAHDLRDAAKAQAAGLMNSARNKTAELADGATQQASDWQDFAKAKTQEWRDAATTATDDFRTELSDQAADVGLKTAGAIDDATEAVTQSRERVAGRVTAAAEYGKATANRGYAAVERTVQSAVNDQNRDKMLLGAAGIAVTAALTLALQRRMNGSA